MELHQVVETAVALVLPDDDALSVIRRVDHKVSAAVVSADGGGSQSVQSRGAKTVGLWVCRV